MQKMLHTKEQLLEALHNKALVITPNNRLSKQLLKHYADKYIYKDSSIAKPICLPYQSFLQYLYKELQHQNPYINHPILLTSAEESYLWKKLLQESNLPNSNYNLLKQLQEAWNRCRLWQVDINHDNFSETWQGEISQNLQKQCQEYLTKSNTITQANLINYIIKYPTFNYKKIVWACFDDYTPAQIILQNHLENHKNEICHYDLQDCRASSLKYQAKDLDDEYKTMLTWLRKRLESNDNNIAIVMPNIETHGNYVATLIKKSLPDEPINISLGQKLTEHMLIAHALLFIGLEENINNCDARLILNSPYINGSQTEFIKRAELMQNLKILKQHTLKIKDLATECSTAAPKLASILTNLDSYPIKARPSIWANIFQRRLQLLGFPGEYSLSSEAYQCLNRLQNLFSEFIKLALISEIMSKSEALDALHFLANASIFQPKQNPSKISILGLLEASGCTFDSIWVMNLTDKCLPGGTNFSAFIPIAMQKSLKMPHSSHERELKYAKQQLIRLQSSCKNIVFSYSSFIDDIPMLPSPLLLNIQEMPKSTSISALQQTKLISYMQNYVIPTHNIQDLHGGTSLLANQAKCPFMAFAKNRLFAVPASSVDDWPNNLERGQILHKILEEFWNQVNTQQKLATLKNDEIDYLINNISQKIISSNQPPIENALNTLIKQGEISRYNHLVKSALKWELSRSNFAVVATEKSYIFNLDGVNFKIRIDRLDTENQAKIIIDYKSSMPSRKPWDEDRPLEPQLLLYALLDDTVNCILYLELKNGHVEASGISALTQDIPGVKLIAKDDWQNFKKTWHQQLTSLLQEFNHGECTPNPTKTTICQTCDLQSLCRIN